MLDRQFRYALDMCRAYERRFGVDSVCGPMRNESVRRIGRSLVRAYATGVATAVYHQARVARRRWATRAMLPG